MAVSWGRGLQQTVARTGLIWRAPKAARSGIALVARAIIPSRHRIGMFCFIVRIGFSWLFVVFLSIKNHYPFSAARVRFTNSLSGAAEPFKLKTLAAKNRSRQGGAN